MNSEMMKTEIVIVSNETSLRAHKDIFKFDEDSYIAPGGDLLEFIAAFEGSVNRLHIASTWIDFIKLVLWKPAPKKGDLFLLLRDMGIGPDELRPFRDSGMGDIFPWLYYGRRFDVLKKICLQAKTSAEKRMKNKDIRVHCHLVSEDTNRIVASSL